MAYGKGDQLEHGMRFYREMKFNTEKPWKKESHTSYRKFDKMAKNRRERYRAKVDPECTPEYRRFNGLEW